MKNWKKVKLGSILTESKIISENPNPNNRIRVKLNVLGIEKRPVTKDKKGATRYYIRKAGQFIYGKQNLHKGAFGIVPEELDGYESSSDIPAFDINDSCYSEWVFYFFTKNNFYLKLEDLAKGVGSKRIQPNQIFDLEIYLPSKEEQRKILDEIKNAEANNKVLLQEIDLQEKNLIKLRQSILQDAIQGTLTKEWREQSSNIRQAKELVEKIKNIKKELVNEAKIKKQKSLPIIHQEEIPFDIPNCWEWVRLQDITTLITDGKHGNCRDELNSGYYFLSAKDIKNGSLIYDFAREINFKEFNEVHQRTDLQAGDLCVVNTGATVGKTAVVTEDPKTNRTTFQKSVAVLKVPSQLINIFYIEIFIKVETPNLLKKSGGSAINNLLLADMKQLLVPLPSYEEQNEIVKRANQLIDKCNNIEQEIIANKENLHSLTQSFLIKLLGEENNILISNKSIEKPKEIISRKKIYNSKTTNMDLITLLKENGKLHAEDLWKMSEHYDDKNIGDSIDKFYSDLKAKIEIDKTIKEVRNEKGYIELV